MRTGHEAEQVPAADPGRPQPQPLEGLLAVVACGDQAAYELVYERVAGPVYGLVRRVVRNPAQSEEVAQEVLLQIWTNAARYDRARGSAMGWIMTLAHGRAVDRVRKEQSDRRLQERATALEPAAHFDTVAEEVAQVLDQAEVRKCLDFLTPLQREAITLTYYGGLTYTQAAARIGAPLGTVKTRIRDGLIKMRDCLGVTT